MTADRWQAYTSLVICNFRIVGIALVLSLIGRVEVLAQQKIRVVTKPVEPFSFNDGGQTKGFSIDLWEAVAKEANLQFEMRNVESVPQMLETLKTKQADVAIAAISITAERHAMMDFSQPYFDSGLQILVTSNVSRNGGVVANLSHQFMNWNTVKVIALVLLVMFAISHLVWWFERRRNAEMSADTYLAGAWASLWVTINRLCTLCW